MRRRKAQVWYTDFVVAVLIFVIALVIYYEYLTNLSAREQSVMEELVADAKGISSSLVSSGSPDGWNMSDVKRIGITDGNMRINQTKLDNFSAMGYDDAHSIFNTRYNFYVFFVNQTGDRINITTKEAIGSEPTDPKDVVQVSRLLIYDSEIIKMQVQLWR